MSFQSMVVKVAGISLIVLFIVLIISFFQMKKNQKYPPVIGGCPDYWELKEVDGKPVCVNKHNLGICGKKASFTDAEFVGPDALCKKAQWAKSCNLTWDGITTDANVCN
jgi:hypothetical protein